jgi:excisionase family DNA binding protein
MINEPAECQELQRLLTKFVSPKEVRQALDINASTFDLRIHQEAVLHTKAGHSTLIPRSEIERLQQNGCSRDKAPKKLPEQRKLEKLLEKFATVLEVAEWLDLSPVTLTQEVTRGQFPYVRAGQAILIPRSVLPAQRVKRVKRDYIAQGASDTPECQALSRMLEQFATTDEIARLAQIKPGSLRNKVCRGRIKYVKVGDCILISRSLLQTIKVDKHVLSTVPSEPLEHKPLREALAKFVTPPEAAKITGITVAVIGTKIRRGQLSAVKVGKSVLIPRSELKQAKLTENLATPSDLPEHKELRKVIKRFYTVREAAEVMGVDIKLVNTARQNGKLFYFKAGSGVLIPKSEVKRFQKAQLAEHNTRIESPECDAMQEILKGFSTIKEAGEFLGAGRAFVYTKIRSREIPSIKVGAGILIPNSQLSNVKSGQPVERKELPEYAVLQEHLKAFTTLREAAEMIGMDANVLQAAITAKKVLGVKAGTSLLVLRSEISRLKKQRQPVEVPPEPPEFEPMRKVLRRFVSLQEAAKILGLEEQTLYVRSSQGGICSISAGSGTLIALTEIERLKARKRKQLKAVREPAPEVAELEQLLKQFVDTQEAMKILKLKRNTLGSRIKSGYIASITAGSTPLIARSELGRVQEAAHPATHTAPECETLAEALKQFAPSKEAADILGITRSELYRLLPTGDLPYVRAGYDVVIPRSAISANEKKTA